MNSNQRKTSGMTSIKILFAVAIAFTQPTFADTLSEDRVRELVLDTIRKNPRIVLEAVQIIEQQEQELKAAATAAVLSEKRELLENDPNAPVLGNPDGDVTIVEFFDYNCPYCRRVKPQIETLLEEDKNVRLVYREWPILGDGSTFAARAALASRAQGKYEEFHWGLMGMNGKAEEASVMRVAEQIGLDIAKLRRDMEAPEISNHIQTSMEMSRELGFTGTPSFVIGDELVPGVIEAAQMIKLVEKARESK